MAQECSKKRSVCVSRRSGIRTRIPQLFCIMTWRARGSWKSAKFAERLFKWPGKPSGEYILLKRYSENKIKLKFEYNNEKWWRTWSAILKPASFFPLPLFDTLKHQPRTVSTFLLQKVLNQIECILKFGPRPQVYTFLFRRLVKNTPAPYYYALYIKCRHRRGFSPKSALNRH